MKSDPPITSLSWNNSKLSLRSPELAWWRKDTALSFCETSVVFLQFSRIWGWWGGRKQIIYAESLVKNRHQKSLTGLGQGKNLCYADLCTETVKTVHRYFNDQGWKVILCSKEIYSSRWGGKACLKVFLYKSSLILTQLQGAPAKTVRASALLKWVWTQKLV